MQPSPIQLRQLFFRHIFIHPNNEDDENIVALDFDFDGVVIQDGSRIKLIENKSANPRLKQKTATKAVKRE